MYGVLNILNVYPCSLPSFCRFQFGAPTDYDEWVDKDLDGSESWAFSNFQKFVRDTYEYSSCRLTS